ncbi:MAG: ATP synthase F1 subunit epsilon [Candidatus Marinimicrobia bacterium]|nr:ATP synthase F1 subunit epsilon [Candidatus Neomarinimicrobiota bacterium]
MAENFIVEVVTPTSSRTFDDVRHVRAPGLDGSFGILARHIPAIIALKPGEVKIESGDRQQLLAISDGYCEIQRERILLLVETAELPEDIDLERAQAALERAQKMLSDHPENLNRDRAVAAVRRAKNRLRIANRK